MYPFYYGGEVMSVFRIEKNKDYTVISNHHLRDKNLSYKAKGLLSFMLSLPDDWDYSINGLVSISKENIKSIRSILKELEDNNYLIRNRVNKENGMFDYEYLIYEVPYTQKGHAARGHAVKGYTLDVIQINTNKINTNKQIDKIDKEYHPLVQVLINEKYIDKYDYQIDYYDKLFNKLLEDYSYNEIIKLTKYITAKVINSNYKDEYDNTITNKYGYFKNAISSNIEKFNSYKDELWNYDDDTDIDDNLHDYSR